jgi:hypothetical protein
MHALRALVLLLLCSGCATGLARGTDGSYALAAVDGMPLPHPSPTEPTVMLEAGALELTRTGGFTLDLVGRVGDRTPDARRVYGTYRFSGRALVLTPDEPLAPPVRYTVRRAPGVLHLRDPAGAEFTFVAREGPAR